MERENKIHILPESMTRLIAAGEVVERPASVAKELIENSIDAGAANIGLLVENAGRDLVQVIDDGSGMSEDDALLCCRNHATSKITTPGELDSIHTLGFRGEALASIGQVSRTTVSTCPHGGAEGTKVEIEAGQIIEVTKTAPSPGTTIAVRNLFFNIPARRKFMKSHPTELRHLSAAFRRIALSHPETAFEMTIDGERSIRVAPGTREERIQSLLDPNAASRLITLEKEISGFSISGFISRPREGRKSRVNQFMFINNRFFVNKSLSHSILAGYGHRLNRDEYPVYIIYFTMDPRHFDVNVHPTKIEVKFSDERFIYNLLKQSVKEALRHPSVVPDLSVIGSQPARTPGFRPVRNPVSAEDLGQLSLDAQKPGEEKDTDRSHTREGEPASLWQIHNRYILSQIKSGLTIIDQHVAHERILYERALKSRSADGSSSQQLLFQQVIQLDPDEYETLTEMLPHLERIGFCLKDFGKNTIVIEAVPVEVKSGREKELLREMIEEYARNRSTRDSALESVASAFACKSAVKSGQRLSTQEMESLIDQLFATDDPYFCPHGRPVLVNIPLGEIDKRFGR